MITVTDFMMGRDKSHLNELTNFIVSRAASTVGAANLALSLFYHDNPQAAKRKVRSGWRPAAVNAAMPGAAANSSHMTGEAVDIEDDDRALARWCVVNKDRLLECGIKAMERPEATDSWVHWQIVPVKSGVFFFWPNKAAYQHFVDSHETPMVA